jgi:LmbE family N-acetylglucosaminyl deacetylase
VTAIGRAADGLSGRVVVVSPHLDDAVLSLGAAIARAARSGARVEVLTVFAGDPASDRPANEWDRKSGFGTEGEAARRRREEDRAACARLGAEPVWLSFGYSDYGHDGREGEVEGAVAAAVEGADAALLPGFPLAHADHAWLTLLLIRNRVPAAHVGLYVEQPYADWAGAEAEGAPLAPQLAEEVASDLRFASRRVAPRERLVKWRAARAYGSQLGPLGLESGLRLLKAGFMVREGLLWVD